MSNASLLPARRSVPLDPATDHALRLMIAMVAALSLVAHADGEMAAAERRRILAVLREQPVAGDLAPDDLAEALAEQEANFRLDPEIAQQIAREALAGVAGRDRDGRRIVAACRALIRADGVAHPAEYRALAEIKALLGFVGDPGRARTPREGLAMDGF